MSRESKLSKSKSAGTPPGELFATIIEDVSHAASMPFDKWFALSSSPFAPLAIPVDSSREYRVTQTGVNAAHTLADQSWSESPALRKTFTRKVFKDLAFKAVGQTIAEGLRHLPDGQEAFDDAEEAAFYAALSADYEKNLDKLLGGARIEVDRHIPCHIFQADQRVPAFDVGPVKFRPRADWMRVYVNNQEQLDLMLKVEGGLTTWAELEQLAKSEEPGRHVRGAWRLLNALDGHPWVATIRMSGDDLLRSHEKASVIVGLAIDALGLRFQVQDARQFVKAGRQHLYSENRIATNLQGNFLEGTSVAIPGLRGPAGALASKVAAEKPFLDAAGKILEAYVRSRREAETSPLVERWANALYWFGEARREGTDFMAVVKYGCAADGLSGAQGKAKLMTEFAEAALNPLKEPTPPKAMSIDAAVTKVYREGRNKLAHGESPGLLEDTVELRNIGDHLLTALFDVVTYALAEYVDSNDPALKLNEDHAYRALKAKLEKRVPGPPATP